MEERMQGRKLATCLALVVLVWATQAEAYKGEQLAPKAKISIAEAGSIALKARHGTISDEELEKERAATYEVGVDAKTGKVLENAREGRARIDRYEK